MLNRSRKVSFGNEKDLKVVGFIKSATPYGSLRRVI